MVRSGLLSLILLEIGLVNGILHLDLSKFLDLIMVDDQGLPVINRVVKRLLCHGGVIRLSEANKSKVSTLLTRLKLDLFDRSELLEELFKLLFSPVRWEIFNI